MLKELKAIRKAIASNAKRSPQGAFEEKWVEDTLRRLDALIEPLVPSKEPIDDELPKPIKQKKGETAWPLRMEPDPNLDPYLEGIMRRLKDPDNS